MKTLTLVALLVFVVSVSGFPWLKDPGREHLKREVIDSLIERIGEKMADKTNGAKNNDLVSNNKAATELDELDAIIPQIDDEIKTSPEADIKDESIKKEKFVDNNIANDESDDQATAKETGPNDCTFDLNEEPYCNWNLDTTNNPEAGTMKWERSNKGTPSSGTGPDKDHTSGNGYFIYIEASPAYPNDKARLSSSAIESGNKCMKFAYSMYNKDDGMGTLNVIIKHIATGFEWNVFTKTGNQLKGWKEQETLINSTSQFKIIIEAIKGSSYQGDIGIDDIVIKNGACADGDKGPIKPISEYSPIRPIGCYHDYGYINGKRPFNQIKNFRNLIEWETWDKIDQSINRIVKDCAAFAKANNYKLFAVEFYGECWTGGDNDYSRDGPSTNCFTATSDEQGDFRVGRENSLMVYKFND